MAWQWLSEDACCQEYQSHIEEFGRWMGGSHYHCPECGKTCGMMGHLRKTHFKFVNGKTRAVDCKQHYCCDPVNCEVV